MKIMTFSSKKLFLPKIMIFTENGIQKPLKSITIITVCEQGAQKFEN